MMQDYKTKDIDPSNPDSVGVTIRAVSQIKNEYHFPGVPHWAPLNIVATTIEEAEALWKKFRKPVNPEAKVEEEQKSDNT